MILLLPTVRRAITGVINRKMAHRQTSGPVNTLIKYDHNYAKLLSNLVAEGDLDLKDATELAFDRMQQMPVVKTRTNGDNKRGPGV